MKRDLYESAFVNNVPYSSSIGTQASTSSTSLWSDASSQHSDDTSITAPTSLSDDNSFYNSNLDIPSWSKQIRTQEVPLEQRQNPRRTSGSTTSRTGCPPTLVRQADRKVNFVDNLVDSSMHIVEAIWPTSSVLCPNDGNTGVLPLRTFIQETLRRSRTSYSTLQVALYYLVLIKPHVPPRDFTMEQTDDCYASRAIQCGRRMFLAGLILASKYLQDRNYSARAWSKISGLNTQEINQNEMAFLLAVNWKLHITEEVYTQWTECVMKFTPPQPPSPGSSSSSLRFYDRQCEDFRNIILRLHPDLNNLDEVLPSSPMPALFREVAAPTLYTPTIERPCVLSLDTDFGTPKSLGTPTFMEPAPSTVYTPGRMAPALGLLPTPRLTPQSSGISTPAVNATSHFLQRSSSMGFAMAQAATVGAAQNLDRWTTAITSSPQSYNPRRSSLATSVSTASSPESMVSDTSRTSRSSSISSSSSMANAPSSKLDVQARCRYAKLSCGERLSQRPTVASVPEDYEENFLSSSPDAYGIPTTKSRSEISLDVPSTRCEREMDAAARALQELQNYGRPTAQFTSAPAVKAGLKRSRAPSLDNSLQDNVRDILTGRYPAELTFRPDALARGGLQGGSRKRLCCSTEAAQYISSLHPAVGGFGGPGMWEGILH
jgi:hypothetical protein